MNRYIRNMNTITEEDQKALASAKVAVVGCGGLGGYVLEQLARLGVLHITAIDGDVFEESNLNRQLLSGISQIGRKKALVAQERLLEINPDAYCRIYNQRLDKTNAYDMLRGNSVVIDSLDNLPSRFLLQEVCENLQIPLVHGAIGGWYGQVAVIFPGDRTLCSLYPSEQRNESDADSNVEKGIEKVLGNPAFTPGLVASIQTAEVLKLLLHKESTLKNHVLRIDLLEHEYVLVPVKSAKE
jgi:molybdopterin/thiamine biosynthesis adenylyltransferase